jgi:hypothetical protein
MLLALATLALCTESRASNGLPIETPDGRFGSVCSGWGADVSVPLCSVPFARLIAVPERFQNRFIAVTGFLIIEDGAVMMYPTPEDYEAGIPFESIHIYGPIPDSWREKARKGVWAAMVIGTFDAKSLGSGTSSLGALNNIKGITAVSRHIKTK